MKRLWKVLFLLALIAGCTLQAGRSASSTNPDDGNIIRPGTWLNASESGEPTAAMYLPILSRPPVPTATFTPTNTAVPIGCTLTHNGAFEQELYDLINAERDEVGLAHLVSSYPLEVSAGEHNDEMATNDYMSHTGLDGSTPLQRMQAAGWKTNWVAEIIMMGVSTPEEAVAWWMGDAPHRDVILGNLTDFGSGYAHCYNHYYTVDFGHR